ncbi:hypothetical protein BVI2075_420044 [Burkholderia vietnamiensis]|nr:hypothetical protein BVI2075_420044 [Burkholderia vietnamiensis]CAG9226754.1 hypothetical protein BVI1335_600055 [Burkholderia vietnamiensis]
MPPRNMIRTKIVETGNEFTQRRAGKPYTTLTISRLSKLLRVNQHLHPHRWNVLIRLDHTEA